MRISIYLLVIIILLIFPQTCADAACEALSVWGLHIVPSLFPYMVISKMLTNQIKKTTFPPFAACLLLGVLGGSPSGAAMISACSPKLSNKAILILCVFTGSISPMFFLGTLKSWLNDLCLAKSLLFVNIAGAILSAVCISLIPSHNLPSLHTVSSEEKTNRSPLSESIDAILQVGGCVICFSVAAALFSLFPLSQNIVSFIHAALEVSGGLHALCVSSFSPSHKRLLLSFASSFGGMSILSQNLLFLSPIGIHPFLLATLSMLRSVFATLTMFFMQKF